MTRPGTWTKARVDVLDGDLRRHRNDRLATEEPMEIRMLAGGERATVAVTMRTPGADFELAAGFLVSEGVIHERSSVRGLSYCVDRDVDEVQRLNIVNVALRGDSLPVLAGLDRHFFTNSACGVCGRATLEELEERGVRSVRPPSSSLAPETLYSLPDVMRRAQTTFESTGGLHAAALFTLDGALLALREDVGRHNAVDKVIGRAFLADELPLADRILMVSGRSSYEIVQKAVVAGIPVVCAVSAPSSLAVDVAERFGITLVGFLRERRMNVYTGAGVLADERGSVEVPEG
ncbi:MAG TPA: formate dehydrogenase accessory sulfurtransferase FdhD [Actinomycetota bacterium]|nr:formate dehydrogenase accessory sulfurtransferase FdhD [Actinomycetota bacterium]